MVKRKRRNKKRKGKRKKLGGHFLEGQKVKLLNLLVLRLLLSGLPQKGQPLRLHLLSLPRPLPLPLSLPPPLPLPLTPLLQKGQQLGLHLL